MSNNNASTNPGNFANRPTEEVKAIASMGGKAAHAANGDADAHNAPPGRNADGTFVKGSEAAKEAGHIGGLHAAGKTDENELGVQADGAGRNPDGTFQKNSEAAKEAGHKGGLAAAAAAASD